MKKSFDLRAFESLPTTLKPSDYVDFLLFCMHKKHCVRLGKNSSQTYHEMITWCNNHNLAYIVSASGYMYIARNKPLAWLAKIADDSLSNHTYFFGKLLSYPSCCSKKLANIGENKIDAFEKELVEQNKFAPPFNLINPEGYVKGYALISHIPCCSECKKSLKLAQNVYRVISDHKEHPSFKCWVNYWLV